MVESKTNLSHKWSSIVFNLIAPIYRKIDFVNSSHYLKAIQTVDMEVQVAGKRILDVGAGAGDWGAMFQLFHAEEIQGVDFAGRMVKTARVKHPDIVFTQGDAQDLSEFADHSFDVVTASFVVHGVKYEERQRMLAEMKRISKNFVVLHDFIGPTPPFIRFLEFLERSDYHNFKQNIVSELEHYFFNIRSHEIKPGTGIYIAEKKQ
ncbi:MAG: class I SAM-dependent methyltransferase [Prolixibacteraceae bacterium]